MRSEELDRRLAELGLSPARFAQRLSEETGSEYAVEDVQAWLTGTRPVPGAIAALVCAWARLAQLEGRVLQTLCLSAGFGHKAG